MATRELALALGTIASAVGGTLSGEDRPAGGFSIDTRTIARNDVFFAIQGDRFDGHAFVSAAMKAGAAGAVVSAPGAIIPSAPGFPLVLVDDTVEALQRLARYVRRWSESAVVAVTGSAGKSTTKEIAAEFLSARYRVFRNKGNLNNHIGLPLSLLELRHKPEIAVVELGMNHSGEIRTLVGIAEPEVRVWTNVGSAHLEFFESVDAIAAAKAEVMEGADKDDLLVANADDDRVMQHAAGFAGRVRTFGINRPADVRALAVQDLGIDGTVARIQTPVGRAEVRTPLMGTANLANVLAATAVAIRFEVPLADIVAHARLLKPVMRRGEVTRTSQITIIDDSYNSNPAALSCALAALANETRSKRRIAVLGEMLELGKRSEDLHQASGREAALAGLSALIVVGGSPARALAESAIEHGLSRASVHHVADSKLAADLAVRLVSAGDLVLVKGSRGIRTDLVADRLKAEFA